MSSLLTTGWHPSAVFGPGVVGKVAIVGAVVAGAAIIEAALIPGLLSGGAAVLAPRLLWRDRLSLGNGRRRAAPSPGPGRAAPTAHSATAPDPGGPTRSTRCMRSPRHSPIGQLSRPLISARIISSSASSRPRRVCRVCRLSLVPSPISRMKRLGITTAPPRRDTPTRSRPPCMCRSQAQRMANERDSRVSEASR